MTTPEPSLQEKDFIQESYRKNPFPFWIWLFLVTVFTALVWGTSSWYFNKLDTLVSQSPFLQVTNREMSLFLWQNPEFMRVNAKDKNGYLTGFQYTDKVTLDLSATDAFVVAPPELLFRYHTWKRLVSHYFWSRPMPVSEFRDFLLYAEEWQPPYWEKAPNDYVKFIANLSKLSADTDLSSESESVIPREVRMAFQGWKNYFKEGEEINQLRPTYAEIKEFVAKNPNYARNFWRNIVSDIRPDYLKTFTFSKYEAGEKVPNDELVAFLKVAAFNFLKNVQTTTKPSS